MLIREGAFVFICSHGLSHPLRLLQLLYASLKRLELVTFNKFGPERFKNALLQNIVSDLVSLAFELCFTLFPSDTSHILARHFFASFIASWLVS